VTSRMKHPRNRVSGPGARPAPDLGGKRRQGQRTEPRLRNGRGAGAAWLRRRRGRAQARSGVSSTAGSGISTGAVGSGMGTISGSGGSTGTGSSGMVMASAVPGIARVQSAVPGSIRR
jgi:hypothetical protein